MPSAARGRRRRAARLDDVAARRYRFAASSPAPARAHAPTATSSCRVTVAQRRRRHPQHAPAGVLANRRHAGARRRCARATVSRWCMLRRWPRALGAMATGDASPRRRHWSAACAAALLHDTFVWPLQDGCSRVTLLSGPRQLLDWRSLLIRAARFCWFTCSNLLIVGEIGR